ATSFQVAPWSVEANRINSLILSRWAAATWMGMRKAWVFIGMTSLAGSPVANRTRAIAKLPVPIAHPPQNDKRQGPWARSAETSSAVGREILKIPIGQRKKIKVCDRAITQTAWAAWLPGRPVKPGEAAVRLQFAQVIVKGVLELRKRQADQLPKRGRRGCCRLVA